MTDSPKKTDNSKPKPYEVFSEAELRAQKFKADADAMEKILLESAHVDSTGVEAMLRLNLRRQLIENATREGVAADPNALNAWLAAHVRKYPTSRYNNMPEMLKAHREEAARTAIETGVTLPALPAADLSRFTPEEKLQIGNGVDPATIRKPDPKLVQMSATERRKNALKNLDIANSKPPKRPDGDRVIEGKCHD